MCATSKFLAHCAASTGHAWAEHAKCSARVLHERRSWNSQVSCILCISAFGHIALAHACAHMSGSQYSSAGLLHGLQSSPFGIAGGFALVRPALRFRRQCELESSVVRASR